MKFSCRLLLMIEQVENVPFYFLSNGEPARWNSLIVIMSYLRQKWKILFSTLFYMNRKLHWVFFHFGIIHGKEKKFYSSSFTKDPLVNVLWLEFKDCSCWIWLRNDFANSYCFMKGRPWVKANAASIRVRSIKHSSINRRRISSMLRNESVWFVDGSKIGLEAKK